MLGALGRSEDPLSGQNEGSAVVGRECWSDDGLVWRTRIKGKLLGNYKFGGMFISSSANPCSSSASSRIPFFLMRYVDSGWMYSRKDH